MEKKTVFCGMKAEDTFLRDCFTSVIVKREAAPTDVNEPVGVSIERRKNPFTGRIPFPLPALGDILFPCLVFFPAELLVTVFHRLLTPVINGLG
jgi:hypothetical protein